MEAQSMEEFDLWITFCSCDLALAAMQSSSPGSGDRTGPKLRFCQLFWSLSGLIWLKKKVPPEWKGEEGKKAGFEIP